MASSSRLNGASNGLPAAAVANKAGFDSGAAPRNPASKEQVARKDEAMGARVHQFDPDATPEEKAAQVAKAKAALAPVPGADIATKKPEAQTLPTGGGQKVAVSTSAADAAKIVDDEPHSTAVPGALPEGPASAIPDWYRIGWSGQSPQGELNLSSEDAIAHDTLGRFVSDLYFANIFYSASVIVFAVLATYYSTRFGGGWGMLLVILGVCGKYQTLAMGRFRHRARDDMTRELAKVRLFTEVETVDWINHFLTRFWLIYEPVLSLTIVQSVDAVLSTACPAFLDSLRLSTFTLGTKAPRIDHVRTFPDTAEDVVVMDWKVSFTPNDTADLTVRQAANKVNPKIVLAIGIGKGPAVLTKDIIVEDITFVGSMRVRLQLMNQFPHVKTVDLSFLVPPVIDFNLKPIGFDIKLIPGLDGFIKGQVDANLGPMMYHPNVFTLDLEQLLSGVPLDVAIGVLQVTVHSGAQLKGIKMGGGNPDPYVAFSISQRVELARTKTKHNTQNPRWGETKYLLINNLNDTLNLTVMDFNDHRKDGELGIVSFDLKQLQQEAEHENVEGRVVLQGKPRGFLKYDVRFFPVLAPKKLANGEEEMVPETQTGIARLVLHQAKELDKKRAHVNQINAYAEMKLDGQIVHTTPTLKRTLAPIWEAAKEVLIFSKPDAVIGIRVLDNRGGTDPQLGYLNIKLNEILEANNKGSDWFPLAGCDTGRVRLTAEWKGVQIAGAINGASLWSPPIGVLRLFIRRGIDLKNVEGHMGGKSDPYIRIHQAGVVLARTLAINNNLDPTWDEYIYVAVHDLKTKFVLEAMDYQDKSKDRTLGLADLPIEGLIEEGPDALNEPYRGTGKQQRTVQLMSDGRKTSKGSVVFEVEFLSCANIQASFDPPDTTTSDNASIITADDASITELPVASPAKSATNAVTKTPTSAGKLSNGVLASAHSKQGSVGTIETFESAAPSVKEKPARIAMSSEDALKSQSGILAMHVVGGNISNPKKRGRLEIFVNSEYWPAYATEAARSEHPTWDEVGESFVRELDFTHVLLKLNSAEKDTVDEVYADARIDLRSFLEETMDKPGTFELTDPLGGHKSTVIISSRYIPTDVTLDPRESINNMGILTVDLLDAKDLLAADRGGKSDPYAVFELNDKKVYKSKVIKKTLNPKWNEEFETSVPSRVGANFIVKVYDWDAVGSPDKLGQGTIDLEHLEPLEPSAITVKLTHPGKKESKGEVSVRLLFRPEFIARTRAATSTFSRGGRVGTGLSSIESVGKGVAKEAGMLGRATGLLHRKTKPERGTTPMADDGASVYTADETSHPNGVVAPVGLHTRDFANEPGVQDAVTGTLKVGIVRANVADPDVKPYVIVSQNGRTLEKTSLLSGARHSDTFTMPSTSGPCILTFTIFDKKTFGKDKPLGAVELDVRSHIMPLAGTNSASPTIAVPDVGSIDVSLDFTVGSAAADSPASIKSSKMSRAFQRHSSVPPTPTKEGHL